jgi:L-alanine-DL-glutamate epimerase-like enolase superfamily enzyme
VVVEIGEGAHRGRGEAVPYARYGEDVPGVLRQIGDLRAAVEAGADRAALLQLAPAGAARNAIDCALWDLEAKKAGVRAWTLADQSTPQPVKTCYTLSRAEPAAMAAAAAENARRPLLKLKIAGADDLSAIAAVRAAAPRSRLIVDANESLDFESLKRIAPDLLRLDVQMLEQPLPAAEDAMLEGYDSPLPLGADESLHTRADLDACAARFACVNVKLDKAGGLTEALALVREVKARGLELMVGCMVGTSLAMAPAMMLTPGARFVDLDGPLLLAKDRDPGLNVLGSMIEPPQPELWG